MSKDRDRTIFRGKDRQWVNKRNDASRASSRHPTQAEAISEADKMLKSQGGGELAVKGLDGKIRDKRTIEHGNDPYPPKG